MTHETFNQWQTAVNVEHREDLELKARAEALEGARRGLTLELNVQLEERSRSARRRWNERVTERELLQDPQSFTYQHERLKRSGEVLGAQQLKGGALRLTLSSEEPIEIEAGDELTILPALFLLPLVERMKGRALTPLAARDLLADAAARRSRSAEVAARLKMGDDPGGERRYHSLGYGFRPAQAAALEAARHLPLTFVWGPPGTGKTHTLGHAVAQLIQDDPNIKILVLATANRGVEQLILRADDACRELTGAALGEGVLLRTQLPTLDEFKRRPHLTAWSDLQLAHKHTLEGLFAELASVENRKVLAAEGAETEELNEALRHLTLKIHEQKEEYKERRAELAARARALFSTVTQHSFVKEIRGQRYDVVIFEEASMIPMFQVMDVLETHDEARVIVSGDPRQLPPIVSEELDGSAWIEHPFAFFKVDDPALAPRFLSSPRGEPLSVLNFLDVQSRMPQDLGDAVSSAFYGGRLRSSRGLGEINNVPGWPRAGLLFVDKEDILEWPEHDELEGLAPKRLSGKRNKCELEARGALILAREAREAGRSVLILTPYRDQRALINALLRAQEVDASCSTVHSAQGDEADVVIFSLVGASEPFLTNEKALFLHTVAFSRAQHQLVVLSDERCEENAHLVPLAARWRRWTRA